MSRFLFLALLVLASITPTPVLSVQTKSASSPATSTTCTFSQADRLANRRLAWSDFDQNSDQPKASMWFSYKRCWRQAVDAGADYLAHGPPLTVRQHAIVTFHMARNLARTGDHAGAARLAAASRRSDQAANAPLDWNSYVAGFYAFLIGDWAGLDAGRRLLIEAGGESNLMNARVLERAQRCFAKPFLHTEERPECQPR